jgi:hypothetical protein
MKRISTTNSGVVGKGCAPFRAVELAFHEAGHAVIAHLNGMIVHSIAITARQVKVAFRQVEPDQLPPHCAGLTTFWEVNARPRSRALCQTLYAGGVSEMILLNSERTFHESSDWLMAHELFPEAPHKRYIAETRKLVSRHAHSIETLAFSALKRGTTSKPMSHAEIVDCLQLA